MTGGSRLKVHTDNDRIVQKCFEYFFYKLMMADGIGVAQKNRIFAQAAEGYYLNAFVGRTHFCHKLCFSFSIAFLASRAVARSAGAPTTKQVGAGRF